VGRQSGSAPNGQAVIRNTEIGGHIKIATPWAAAATSSRAFSASGNRLYEYQNTGAGAAPGGAPSTPSRTELEAVDGGKACRPPRAVPRIILAAVGPLVTVTPVIFEP